jgi:tetratricopeptide (TPR) repeat protein
MSNNIQNILDEEFKLLIRATRNELFHFISVQYNHYDLVRKVKKDLVAQYPNRSVHSFNLDNCNPETFIHDILTSKSGLVFIEKFDLIFTEPFRSLCIGFNQRRDLFSTFPIQIIVFIPSGEENLQNFQKAMPDVFSIVNPMIQLVQEIETSEFDINTFENNDYNFANSEEAKSEIHRISKRLNTLNKSRDNKLLTIRLKLKLAKCYEFLGQYLKSKKILENLLFELEESSDKLHFDLEIAEIRNNLATQFKYLGEYQKAKSLLEKNVSFTEYKFGESHELTIATYSNLAVIFHDLGMLDEAKNLSEKVVLLSENRFGKSHSLTAIRYSNLAAILVELNEFDKAKLLAENALTLSIENFGENHLTTIQRYANLAMILQSLGDYELVKKILKKVIILKEENLGKDHPSTAQSYFNLATTLFYLIEMDESLSLMTKAYQIYLKLFGENHPDSQRIKQSLDTVEEMVK